MPELLPYSWVWVVVVVQWFTLRCEKWNNLFICELFWMRYFIGYMSAYPVGQRYELFFLSCDYNPVIFLCCVWRALLLLNWWNTHFVLFISPHLHCLIITTLWQSVFFFFFFSLYTAESFPSDCHNFDHKEITINCNWRQAVDVITVCCTNYSSLIKDLIGWSRPFGSNKNICRFSVASLCCWNLREAFCVGFRFQTSRFISRCGISSSSTVCYCKAAVEMSAAGVCVSVCVCCTIILLVLSAFSCVLLTHVRLYGIMSVWQFELVH